MRFENCPFLETVTLMVNFRWGGQTAVPAFIPNVKKKSTILLDGETPMTAEKRSLLDKLERDQANKTVTMKTQIDLSSVGDEKAQKIYLINCQIQEISALLATPDLVGTVEWQ